MESEKLSLIQKLAKIRSMSGVVSKEKRGYNYNYADITTILANITTGMKKYGVSLIPSIKPDTAHTEQTVINNTKVDKTGKPFTQTTTEMLVSAEMVFTWVNDEDPKDRITVPWFVIGSQSDPSQAFGSGLTYCTRYFLTNFFQIAQPETDVDSYRTKQKMAEAAEAKAIADAIISSFDVSVRGYLLRHPDKSEEVKEFIGKYVKNANYLAIKDPEIAGRLSDDFSTTYINKEESN